MPQSFDALVADFEAGKAAALARAISIVENHRPGYDELMTRLHPHIGRAQRLGITGPPGAGKSTVTNLIVQSLRQEGHTVGVIAVDPTSPFTGGALLGDRVRMESVALDPGVYIRSMATRGSLGGLSARTAEVADVLDAFGFDRIIIETVGVGQTELDIARTADTTVVVLVPESGDSIQTLKAGVMEIADIFVVNKGDRPGADRLRNDIELMLGLRRGSTGNVPAHHGVQLKSFNPIRIAREAARAEDPDRWTPPVLGTIASRGEGIDLLLAAVGRHFRYLETSGALKGRRRIRLRNQVAEVVAERVRNRLWEDPETNAWLDAQLDLLESGAATPFTVADELLQRSGPLLTGVET
ncbi:MAG TPA: methylmalonyl Co-A mutase-associated GTPase MeaB [Gemmatimonadaceae bacterium]|nr:methylmalonyl Co-A mutase-associated GTPase MeaB [Gemmatimonadaceae bacterium]